MRQKLKTLLPPSIRPDRFTEATIAAISNFPEVLEADKDSLYRACVMAAKRGLLPDKDQGALVIFNTNVGTKDRPIWQKQVQFMPMVKGIIMEMAKAGIRAYAVSVHAADEIALWNDDAGQHVLHKPKMFGERGDLMGVFAAGTDLTGRTYVEAMSKGDIEKVRARSKQKDQNGNATGTWKTDYDRMAQKSALHRLRKRLPITDEDAAQNVYDMEEEPGTEATPRSEVATPTDPQQAAAPALPSPEVANQQDEVLKPKPRARRPRVMDQVMASAKPPVATVPPPKAAQAPEPVATAEPDEGDII